MIRKALVTAVIAVVAMITAVGATAAVPAVVDGDGGGAPPAGTFWIEESYTYDSTGFPIFLYCRYGSDGYRVYQISCWS